MASSASKKKAAKKADFALWLHAPSGQWCKKIKQKVHYFGKDRDEAAKRWKAEKDALLAGEPRKGRGDRATITELANVFVAAQKERLQTTGKPGIGFIQSAESSIKRLQAIVGKNFIAADLSPMLFGKIKLALFAPVERAPKSNGSRCKVRAPATVAKEVRCLKIFLNWCHKNEYIPAPRYGDQFGTETAVAITKESIKLTARKDWAAKDIHAVINAVNGHFKPLLWLAVNSGLGNADIACIDFDDIKDLDEDECWMDLPRLKTGAKRRFLLWPETKSAIKEYLKIRRCPMRQYATTVFLTCHGFPWVRGEGSERIDTVGSTFSLYRKAAGLTRGSFYDLRRTFATIACETLDFEAVRQCMGHVPPSKNMLARYATNISDDRLAKVSNHVRSWMMGGVK